MLMGEIFILRDPFSVANGVKAGLWALIALVLATRARGKPLVAAISVILVAFGASDIVEISTGAWWRPWWLLVWKGVCVSALLTAIIFTKRSRARMAKQSKTPTQ